MPLPDFHEQDDQIGDLGSVGEFWRWAMSDMLGNRNRGILAEYIVAKLLDVELSHPRLEWDCYDLIYRGYKIEVKSSAYIQTWHQSVDQRSTLRFGVSAHTCWDARDDTWAKEKKRWADLYVFCVFPANSESYTRDALDLSHWRFHVASTRQLELNVLAETDEIGLTKVRQICGDPVGHVELRSKVNRILKDVGDFDQY